MPHPPIEILFEDTDILVIHKPAGMVVNDALSVGSTATIQTWFHDREVNKNEEKEWSALIPTDFKPEYGTPEEIYALRQGIVHRLDKDTSGVLVLAKNPGALVHLLAQFKQRTTHKEYLCLTHGKFGIEKDTIDMPIGRSSKDRKTFDTKIEGRQAVTEYSVEAFYPHFDEKKWLTLFKESKIENSNYHYTGNHKNYFKIYQGFSLVRCIPHTGRTHQIRVHMAHVRHPIVGDTTYAGNKRNRADALWCTRQFLHAAKLVITHPRTGERVTFEASLPEELQLALELVTV